MRWSIFLFLCVVHSPADSRTPKWRYQDAVIEQHGSTICFKISDSKDSRTHAPTIRGVNIGEQHPDRYQKLWEAYFVQSGFQEPSVSPNDCIPYQKIKTLPELERNKAYTLFIIGDQGNEPRRYSAKFCLIEKDGVVSVHQVLFDRKRKSWNWDQCGIPYQVP